MDDTRIALDLSRYWWRQQHGDITALGTWFGTTTRRPVLVLVPSYKEGYERVTPCIVPMDMLWAWSEEYGDPAHAARTSYQFATLLGLEAHNAFTCFRITDIIRSHIGDMLAMPPEPVERVAVADAILTREDGRTIHREVYDRV